MKKTGILCYQLLNLIFLVFVTQGIIFSCQGEKTNNVYRNSKVLLLSKNKEVKEFNGSSIIESIDYVFLSTQQNSIIAKVSDLFIIHDTIIVYDRKLNSILTFSMDGKFIKRINSTNDLFTHKILSVSQFDNGILINISNEKFVLYVDLKGNLIYKIQTSVYKLLFGGFDEESFWSYFPFVNIKYNNNEHFQYSLIDGSPTNRFIPPLDDCFELHYVPRIISYTSNGICYVFSAETNTIYSVLKEGVSPTYSFVFEKTPSTTHLKNNIFDINWVVESEDYIFIDAIADRSLINYVYFKAQDSIITIPKIHNTLSHIWGINNDIDHIYPIWPTFSINNHYLARVVMAKDIKNFQAESEISADLVLDRNDSILKIIEAKNLIDNPLIILYKLRDEK